MGMASGRPARRSAAVVLSLLAGAWLLTGCGGDTEPSGAAAAPAAASSSSSAGAGAAEGVAERLCQGVDSGVAESVVGPGVAGEASEDSTAWECRWAGKHIPVGPNGAVAQPVVEVRLYRLPLSITEGTAAPTQITVAGRAATMSRGGPRLCQVTVVGTERTLTVSMSTPVDQQDTCPRARAAAERLVPQVLR